MRIVLVFGLAAILVAGCVSSGAASPEPSETPPSATASSDPSTVPSPSATPATPTATPTTAAAVASASPTPSAPAATAEPTPPPVPPKPTGASFDDQWDVFDVGDAEYVEITQTVTWQAPRDAGVEIRVYGVTECTAEPDDPAPGTSGPCLVVNTKLPESIRVLLATAPASAGTVSWSWTELFGCDSSFISSPPDGPRYYAVVLAAYGPSDHSIFAIAEPGQWRRWDPGDTPC